MTPYKTYSAIHASTMLFFFPRIGHLFLSRTTRFIEKYPEIVSG